jgi:hypothetical protein
MRAAIVGRHAPGVFCLSASTVEGKLMRMTLAALGFAAGLGIITCQSAAAMPIAPDAIQQMATATTGVQQAQYSERRGRHTTTKCYREFVVGNYVCHTYRNW